MPSKEQIKKIHTLLSALGIDDATYREMLSDLFGVSTCKALSFREAGTLITRLEKGSGKRPAMNYPRRFDKLGIREGMATPKQLRNIEGLWFDVTRQGTREEGLRALREFLRSRFGVDGIELVKDHMVSRILTTLKVMKVQEVKNRSMEARKAARAAAKAAAPPETSECQIFNFADYAQFRTF
jgi:hypothetical protein